MIEFLSKLLPLAFMIFQEFFSAKARAREANKKFELDEATFHAIIDSATTKLRARAAAVSQGAANAWDAADQEVRDRQNQPPQT